MNVIPKKGQGTVITGVKVAFQAFPKPDSGGGSVWTEPDGYCLAIKVIMLLNSGVIVKSGVKQSKITQYATGESYFS